MLTSGKLNAICRKCSARNKFCFAKYRALFSNGSTAIEDLKKRPSLTSTTPNNNDRVKELIANGRITTDDIHLNWLCQIFTWNWITTRYTGAISNFSIFNDSKMISIQTYIKTRPFPLKEIFYECLHLVLPSNVPSTQIDSQFHPIIWFTSILYACSKKHEEFSVVKTKSLQS